MKISDMGHPKYDNINKCITTHYFKLSWEINTLLSSWMVSHVHGELKPKISMLSPSSEFMWAMTICR
jgi:hypothetical protein